MQVQEESSLSQCKVSFENPAVFVEETITHDLASVIVYVIGKAFASVRKGRNGKDIRQTDQ